MILYGQLCTREAQVQGGVQGANVHPELRRIGGRNCPQLALKQRLLYLAPLLFRQLDILSILYRNQDETELLLCNGVLKSAQREHREEAHNVQWKTASDLARAL